MIHLEGQRHDGVPVATACGSFKVSRLPGGETVIHDRAGETVVEEDEDVRKVVREATLLLEAGRIAPNGGFVPPERRPLPAEFVAATTAAGRCVRCIAATAAEDTWPQEPERISDADIKEFVLGLADGRLFTSAHVGNPRDVMLVFMVLALMPNRFPEDYARKVGVLWEWLEKAGPRSVNGMPCFFSARIMHVDDWKRALDAYERFKKEREAFTV